MAVNININRVPNGGKASPCLEQPLPKEKAFYIATLLVNNSPRVPSGVFVVKSRIASIRPHPGSWTRCVWGHSIRRKRANESEVRTSQEATRLLVCRTSKRILDVVLHGVVSRHRADLFPRMVRRRRILTFDSLGAFPGWGDGAQSKWPLGNRRND
jgi:hypothetical protein